MRRGTRTGVRSRDPFPGNRRLTNQVVRRLSRRLTGRTYYGLRVAAVFHYGAVTLDPNHLVVWLLLEGRPDADLPAWLSITPALPPSMRPTSIDYDWLLALRAEVCSAFREAGWPESDHIHVSVDSEHRVRAGGGWDYFH